MGAVFEAIDLRLQNTVALKQTTVSDPDADRAFEREARILAGLRHPALPVVIDYFTDQGGHFLVMQFIDGDDLSRLLRRQSGPCALDEVLDWARAILEALIYLHDHVPPVIHRDIKPANLRRTPRGEIVLLDFGLAKTGLLSETRTVTERSVYGFTPSYAPPEQVDRRITDTRSDIYALGATLYHLATGAVPARASERLACAQRGVPDPLVSPQRINERIGDRLSQVVERAMALDPEDRFASAAEMRDALFGQADPRAPRRAPPRAVDSARRIDAAMPSVTEVGRQTDLIVQVRFEDSPVLGIEDWPTRRRPEHIEQGSESLRLVHPVDLATGAQLPARLRIKLAAPDFAVEGDAERLIDVPPDDYSKRLAFFLTPRRAGFCRVNVEVFGPDALYLGCIPVEVEAQAGETTLYADVRVANLVLEVFARQMERPTAVAARPSAPPTGLGESGELEADEATEWGLDAASRQSAGGAPPVPRRARPDRRRLNRQPGAPLDGAIPTSAGVELPAPQRSSVLRRALVYAPLIVVALATAVMFWPTPPRPPAEPPDAAGQPMVATEPLPLRPPIPLDGAWRATVTGPVTVRRGQPCASLVLTNIVAAVFISQGRVNSAQVTVHVKGTTDPSCTSQAVPPNTHRYRLSDAQIDGRDVVIGYASDPYATPVPSRLTLRAVLGDDGNSLDATLRWLYYVEGVGDQETGVPISFARPAP